MKRLARIAPAVGLALGLCLALFGPLGLAVGNYSYVGDYSYGVGGIFGTVTDEAGVPLEAICVHVDGSGWSSGAETDSTGAYRASIGGPGPASVSFGRETCNSSGYIVEWWNDKPEEADADLLDVSPGDTVTGIDAQLTLGGRITGRLTDEEGDPVPHVCVEGKSPSGTRHARTNLQGLYELKGLDTGEVIVGFDPIDCAQDETLLPEWFDNKPDEFSADPVSVTVRQETSGIDAVLSDGGSLAGVVTTEDGQPLAGVCVSLLQQDPPNFVKEFTTNTGGMFSFRGLPPGAYKVRFVDCLGRGFATEWFDDKPTGSEADEIHVDFSQDVTGIDAALKGPGVVVTETGGSTQVGEGGPTDTYEVVLKTRPNAGVTVRPQGNAQVSVSPTSLLFSTSNWGTPKTVTVSAVNDTIQEGPHEAQITHTVTSSDGNYNGITAPGVLVSITDNDEPKPATVITYTGQATVRRNEVVQLSATLRDAVTGDPLSGRTVSFALKSGSSTRWTVSATTDASGVASASRQVTDSVGSYSLVTSFAGDATFAATSVTTPFAVTAHPTSLTYSGPSSVLRNDPVPLSARLVTETGSGLEGRSVTFRVKQGATTLRTMSGITNSQGVATQTFIATEVPGSYVIESSFAGDGTNGASVDTDPLDVLKRPTAAAYTGPAAGSIQSTATLTARLTDMTTGGALASRQVTFVLLDGGTTLASATATTNPSGVASAGMQIPGPAGDRVLEARFAGDATYEPRTASAPFQVERRATALSAGPSGERPYAEALMLQGTATDQLSGQKVQGAELSFELVQGGATVETGIAVTDANGVGTLELTDVVPGAYEVRVTFAGDPVRAPAEASSELTVAPADTSITGSASISAVRGTTATMSGTLSSEGVPLAGRTLVFTLGSQEEEAVTGADGKATVQMLVNEAYGSHTLTIRFEGEERYLPSAHSRTFNVTWEMGYADLRDPTHQVWLNGITKEFQVVIPGDTSAVKSDPTMTETPLPDGSSWLSIRYMDADLTLVGSFRRQGTLFAAGVKTPENAYLLFN